MKILRLYKILGILLATTLLFGIVGCSALDPLREPFYAEEIHTWNGTAWNLVTAGGGGGIEVDPVWTASDAFGITALNRANWTTAYNNRVDVWTAPLNLILNTASITAAGAATDGYMSFGDFNLLHSIATDFVPYVGATGNIDLNTKEVTNGTLNAMVGKGTWTASGTWKLPAMFFNGDITTDRWLSSNFNTFLGSDVVGAENLVHTVGGTGYNNTAVGYHALYSANTSWYNSAFGSGALQANTEGYFNSAFGTDAMSFNINGNMNTAIGVGALSLNTSGSFNTAIGVSASGNNTTGMYNTAIGEMAGYNNSAGDRNVFIGYKAGLQETGSDKLYIDNSDTLTPLIYGDFSTNLLTINGSLIIPNNYFIKWKNAIGTAQDILSLDTANVFNIANPNSNGININYGESGDIHIWGDDAGTGEELVLNSSNATAGSTLQDSPIFILRASYWN